MGEPERSQHFVLTSLANSARLDPTSPNGKQISPRFTASLKGRQVPAVPCGKQQERQFFPLCSASPEGWRDVRICCLKICFASPEAGPFPRSTAKPDSCRDLRFRLKPERPNFSSRRGIAVVLSTLARPRMVSKILLSCKPARSPNRCSPAQGFVRLADSAAWVLILASRN